MTKFFFFLLFYYSGVVSQTVGLLQNNANAFDGYTLFAKAGTTYLINNTGEVVHTWDNGTNTMHPGYLQDNGDLMVVSRGVKRIDWNGNQIWRYTNVNAHHDVAIMPNGHVLLLISGFKTNAEAIAAGRNPSLLDGDIEPMVIYEINTSGNVIWQWQVWDHLVQDYDVSKDNYAVVANHPELVDLNFTRNNSEDWLHSNAIDYNPELDQIMVSPRFNSEIWIIDHSTNTAQAATHSEGNSGKGGDLLYRWGNPIAYRAGNESDQTLFGSHDAQWIKAGLPSAGNIMVFNNGGTDYGRDGNYSSINEWTPPVNGFNYDLNNNQAYGPNDFIWSYQEIVPEDFYSSFISGVQRLANGNTLIDEGENGLLFEVTTNGNRVWQYQNPVTNNGVVSQGSPAPVASLPALFRAYRYAIDYSAFDTQVLDPNGTVELYNAYSDLTVQSTHNGGINYPAQGTLVFGQGQLVTLIANELPLLQFSHWSVEAGSALFDNEFDPFTTFVMTAQATVIQANFIAVDDLIFLNSFE